MTPDLTLAVPTFNRKGAIIENTRHALEGIDGMSAEYLVIDNASDDGTYDALLSEFGDNSQAQFLRNSENIGYFGNFLKLLKECKTRYILISSDEDFFLTENISYLLKFLREKRPTMVSGQVFISGKRGLYRGRAKVSEISCSEVRESSNHVSGIVYDCFFLKDYLDFIECSFENQMVFIYPQVVLAAIAHMKGRAYWLNLPLTKKAFELETSIIDGEGKRYFDLESRVRQLRDYDRLLKDMSEKFDCGERSENLRKHNMYTAFSIIRNALGREADNLYINSFDEAAQYFYFERMVKQPLILFGILKRYVVKKIHLMMRYM